MATIPMGGQPAGGTAPVTIRVSDAAGLSAALAGATGGETILLADGDYGAMTLSGQFGTAVTIRAETPLGARFTGLSIASSSGMVLDGLLLDYVAAPGAPSFNNRFNITDSSGITLRNSLLDGDRMDDPTDPGHGYPTGRGLRVTGSDSVVIEDNTIRGFWKALNIGTSTDVVVRGNDIHDIRSDGINLSAVDTVLIENNHIHDFCRNLDTGDHPDMIQMWSSVNPLVPRNITIRDNYLDIGDGAPVQSIFLAHNAASRQAHGADVAFENIAITGNVIINGQDHGITLGITNGAVIANNTVIAPPHSGYGGPRISVDSLSTGVFVTDNIAERIQYLDTPPPGWVMTGNLLVQSNAPDQLNHYSSVFINAMSDATNAPENLQILPGSPADLAGAGAAQLHYDPAPDALTALGHGEVGALANEIRFDAGYSAGPGGHAAAAGASFDWDFGDGTTGAGETTLHRYTQAGVFTAVLTVTLPDGSQDTSAIRTEIRGPDFLTFSAATGTLLLHDPQAPTVIDPGTADDAAAGRLDFNAATSILLPAGSEAALEGAGSLTIALQLEADAAGTLMALKSVFGLSITAVGELQAYMPGLAGGALTSTGAGLLDGKAHDVLVAFDGSARSLTLSVDARTVLSVDAGADTLPWVLDGNTFKIGATGGTNGFSGHVTALDIEVDADRYDLTPLPVASSQPMAPRLSGGMEIGTVSIGQTDGEEWSSVSFSEVIPDARVVMGPLSAAGGQAAFVRIRNVTDTGFEFQIDEWDYLDGRHQTETVSWLAASAGSHVLASGQRIVVGRDTLTDETLQHVALDGVAPRLVMAQITSASAPEAVVTRVSVVTATGFDLHMQEQESKDGLHAAETVDWIALDEHADGFDFVSLRLDQNWQTTAAPAPGAALLGGMQGEAESDSAVLRYRAASEGRMIALQVQEEQSADRETAHLPEDTTLFFADHGHYQLFA